MRSRSDVRRMTAGEFAKMHSIAASTVRKWRERGKVQPVGKRGLADEFLESDLLAVFESSVAYDREHLPRSADGRFRPVGRS